MSYFNNIMDFFRAQQNFSDDEAAAKPAVEKNNSEKSATEATSGRMTNQQVMDELVKNFETKLKEVSFDNVVTFPMSFTVIMHDEDFKLVKDYAGLLARQAVSAFYAVIDKYMTEDKICEHLATYWKICFVPCHTETAEMDGEAITVRKGQPMTLSSVFDTVLSPEGEKSDEGSTGGSQFTVTVSGSTFYGDVNINHDALKNLTMVTNTHFKFPWEKNKIADAKAAPASKPKATSVAKLEAEGKEFYMQKGTYMVSGGAETRNDSNIFCVDNDYVMNGHIRIQHIEKENKFKIAAFAETALNGVAMLLSKPTDIRWMNLENGCIINLADEVEVKFETLV